MRASRSASASWCRPSPIRCLRKAVARSGAIRFGGENTAEIVCGQVGLGEGQGNQPALESGLVIVGRSFEQSAELRQSGDKLARFLVRLAQEPAGIGIVRTQPEQMREIGNRFGPLLLLVEHPAAMDQGFDVVGLDGEPAVQLGEFGAAPRSGARGIRRLP